jgi:adenylate kinase
MGDQERSAPVIVITGTPGTGKSTTAAMLVDTSPIPLKHINVGDLVKSNGLHEGYDEEWQSYLVDDDKVSIVISIWFCPLHRRFLR